MQTIVINTEKDWVQWRAGWNSLARENPMLSLEWLQAWWHHFGTGHQLQIVAVVEDDRLIGALPSYLHETRLGKQLRFLGSGTVCSDYVGPLVDPLHAERACAAISRYLCAHDEHCSTFRIESLHFEGVTATDQWLGTLETAAETAGFSMRRQSMVNSWSLELSSSWSELHESQRGHGVFRKAKKCVARLESGELHIRQLCDSASLDEGMGHLIRLHQARRESVGDRGCFADPRFERFLREALAGMMSAGTACFCLCQKDEHVIGIQLLLIGSDTVYMYQSGVDPENMSLEPGHAIVTGSLLYAIQKGYRKYDFLRGDEPYKAFWGARPIPLQRVILAPPTLKAQTIEAVQRNLLWLRSCYQDLSGSGAVKS